MTSKSKFKDISVESYTERSVVVRGDTRKYKEDLKKLGGKYNGRLKNGPGWIFSKKVEKNINDFINGGVRLVSEQEVQEGEERTKAYRNKEYNETHKYEEKKEPKRLMKKSVSTINNIGEDSEIMKLLRSQNTKLEYLTSKIDMLEHAILLVLDDEQMQMFTEIRDKIKSSKEISQIQVTPQSIESESEEEIPHKRLLR
jgi:hypothetical protein